MARSHAIAIAALASVFVTSSVQAQSAYSTGFESMSLGSVVGQEDWNRNSNSATLGTVTNAQSFTGSQSMELTTLSSQTDMDNLFGVIDSLRTPVINAAGEFGSVGNPVMANQMKFSYWYRTPLASVDTDDFFGALVEIDPSRSFGAGASRYAGVFVYDGAQDQSNGQYYTAADKIVLELDTPLQYGDGNANWDFGAVVKGLDYGTWYNIQYDLTLVNGLAGNSPNDVFSVSVFNTSNTLLGSYTKSTWEVGMKDGRWGNTTAWALDSISFRTNTKVAGQSLGFIDGVQLSTVPEPASMLALSGGLLALLRRRRQK
ncbi:MAG: PEP-CTERM sorting domain-containing protein [Armatimonadota bacterium]